MPVILTALTLALRALRWPMLAAALIAMPATAQRAGAEGDDGRRAPVSGAVSTVATASGAAAIAVRIDATTVLLATAVDENQTVTLRARRSGLTVSGSVVADGSNGLSLARFAADQLDRAQVPIVPMAQAMGGFGDYVRIVTPQSSDDSALFESPKFLWVFDRDTVALSGAYPSAGGAAFNACGELLGLLPVDADEEFARSRTLAVVRRMLSRADIDVDAVADACDVDEDGLTVLADKLAADADAARARADQFTATAAQLRQQRASARRLQTVEADAQESREAAERADKARDRLDDFRSGYWWSIIIGIVALVAVVGIIIGSIILVRRNQRFVRDREQSIAVINQQTAEVVSKLETQPWRDVVLRGTSGILKIGAHQFSGDGVIIGRSPTKADVVFAPTDISRQHAKLYVSEQQLWIEDMESAGGTFVNGRRIDAAVMLKTDDLVRLSSHELKVTIL